MFQPQNPQFPRELAEEMLSLAVERTSKFDRAGVLHHAMSYLESSFYPHLLDLALEVRAFVAIKDNNQTHVYYPAPKSSYKIDYAIKNMGRLPSWLIDKHLASS